MKIKITNDLLGEHLYYSHDNKIISNGHFMIVRYYLEETFNEKKVNAKFANDFMNYFQLTEVKIKSVSEPAKYKSYSAITLVLDDNTEVILQNKYYQKIVKPLLESGCCLYNCSSSYTLGLKTNDNLIALIKTIS